MWKQIKAHPRITLSVLFLITLALTILIGGYRYQWAWTGLTGDKESYKTLYDWLQLLFIPVVLAVAGFWFNHRERIAAELRSAAEREIEQKRAENEQKIALDNRQEAALQSYINEMSELLLHEKLRDSTEDDEVRKIARVRTITILPSLDGKRKGNVIQFLYESGLIDKNNTIIDLLGADLNWAELGTFLSEINLSNAILTNAILTLSDLKNAQMNNVILTGAYLDFADLSDADLHYSRMNETNLFRAKFVGANLRDVLLNDSILVEADLSKSDLTGAIFDGANLIDANLRQALVDVTELEEKAKSLKGATMPDGSIHE
jgi:hypothetical protein